AGVEDEVTPERAKLVVNRRIPVEARVIQRSRVYCHPGDIEVDVDLGHVAAVREDRVEAAAALPPERVWPLAEEACLQLGTDVVRTQPCVPVPGGRLDPARVRGGGSRRRSGDRRGRIRVPVAGGRVVAWLLEVVRPSPARRSGRHDDTG